MAVQLGGKGRNIAVCLVWVRFRVSNTKPETPFESPLGGSYLSWQLWSLYSWWLMTTPGLPS